MMISQPLNLVLRVFRWNTLWSRVLKVYVATAQQSNQLQRIANMVVKFSVPMWFQIKRHSYMTDGLHNTFVNLQLLKHLNNTEINIVKEMVQKCLFCSSRPTPACHLYR